MKNLTIRHSIRQMFLAVAGFVVGITLLESGGLENWANGLDPGALRSIAVPAATALNKLVQPLGIDVMRRRALQVAARTGWTDDAVQLARNAETSNATSELIARAPSAALPPAAALAPLAASVPRDTTLAPLELGKQGKPRVVVLTGDSMMAVGLSSTLMRQAGENKSVRFVKAFRSGTGLARPDVFNWIHEYPAMIGSEKPDVVIVSIGANDGQGFVVDDKVQLFGTAEWRKTYQTRVADFLAMVESSGARVVWVGLPPMRLENYNQRIAVINRIVYTVVSQDPRATWWNSAPFVADDEGGFQEFASLPNGKTMRVRAEDGIHFSDEGAGLMSSVLMKWLAPPLQTATPGPDPSLQVRYTQSARVEARVSGLRNAGSVQMAQSPLADPKPKAFAKKGRSAGL